MPAISDAACATAVVGEVVFTEGTLDNGLSLRVVAGQDEVIVATWDSAAIVNATKECPWLADDLKLLADGFQALAGACIGPLGDRLDESLRSLVTSRCEIRTLLPGEQLCAAKKPVPGMHIIGGGEIELVDENGRVNQTHGTGEFLFAAQVLAGGGAPFSARAGSRGALVLFAPRMAAHELLVSVPPLLEILAD
jgi:CRP-like cAMP-binding protein